MDLEVAARAALAELYDYHVAQAARIEAAIGALNVDVVIEVVATAPSPPALERAERRPGIARECPECGKSFAPAGYGPHVKSHERATARSFPEQILAAAADADVERARTQDIFKCGTCSAVFTISERLANHTIIDHGRGPTHAENTAVAA